MGDRERPFGFGVGPVEDRPVADFEHLLRQWRAPKPQREFRDSIRSEFLALDSSSAGDSPSVKAPVAESVTPSAENTNAVTLGTVLQDWTPEPARPDFRAQLRDQFLGGESMPFSETAHQEGERKAVQPRQVKPQQARSKAEHAKPNRGRKQAPQTKAPAGWKVWGSLLASAAAILLAWRLGPWSSVGQPDAGSAWSVPLATILQGVRIDGEAFVGSQDDFTTRLASAKRVQASATGNLELSYARLMRLSLSPGSVLDLNGLPESPDSPTEGSPLRLDLHGESGHLVVQTGPDFKTQGWGLTVGTPEAEVLVTGTVFAVDRYAPDGEFPGGTCVCCDEGSVRVLESGKQEHEAGEGESVFVFCGEHETKAGKVVDGHKAPMTELRGMPEPTAWSE